jgi:hypothetical protein
MSASTPAGTPPGTTDLSPAVLGRALVIQQSRVVGLRHHAAPALWPALHAGVPLVLAAETDNPHDPQAVAVFWRGCKLGYLPRTENLVVSRLLARHRTLGARVQRLHPDAPHDQRLWVEVLML